MSKPQRASEKWFHRGLWLVAVIFASFLIGLGGQIVGDLPMVDTDIADVEDFIDADQRQENRQALSAAEAEKEKAETERDNARDILENAQNNYEQAHDSFKNWLATRGVTADATHDAEVTTRTRALDVLKKAEIAARQNYEARQATLRSASSRVIAIEQAWQELIDEAQPQRMAELRRMEMRVFLIRLAVTLPLLLVAGYLFAKQRKNRWWPFAWGFIFFALFVFFVELVPYLPDYGGYIRYVVGIIVTAIIGRQAIIALQNYLERQKLAEALPVEKRQTQLNYDTALSRLAQNICPGCERAVDLKDGVTDFCPHCGIGLFKSCGHCGSRKSAFARFCFHCGSPENHASQPDNADRILQPNNVADCAPLPQNPTA